MKMKMIQRPVLRRQNAITFDTPPRRSGSINRNPPQAPRRSSMNIRQNNNQQNAIPFPDLNDRCRIKRRLYKFPFEYESSVDNDAIIEVEDTDGEE